MKYAILVSLFILSFSTLATPTCSKNGTAVIYTNGVTTSKNDAKIALEKIKALGLNSQIDLKPENVKYVLAYNYEATLSSDLLEAAVQRFPAGFLRSLGVKDSYAAYMEYLGGGLSGAIYTFALSTIAQKILEIESNWIENHRSYPLYLQTVQEVKGHYVRALNNGERVLAISHSQGGLFMRDAFQLISFAEKQKFFSGFQVATPLDSEMNSHFGYATHDKDRLINFVRGTVGALPANVSTAFIVNNAYEGISDYAVDFIFNHGIVTTYLNDTTIRSQVISRLIEAAELLDSNCPKAVINYNKNNHVVSFDSTDPEYPEMMGLTYSWDFGDGKTANTPSKTILHTYAEDGKYNVSLTVRDSYGASDSEEAIVIIDGLASITFCNMGLLGNEMRFQIDGVLPFSLMHVFPESGYNYDPHICECKIVQLPKDRPINIHVDGTELYTGENISLEPYSGTIYTNGDYLQPFSTNVFVRNGVLAIGIYRGIFAVNYCGPLVYK